MKPENYEQIAGESRSTFRKRRWREQQRTLGAKGELKSVVEVRRGRKNVPVVGIPERTSTLYDREGRVTAQWVKNRPDDRGRQIAWEAAREALIADLPRVRPILSVNQDGWNETLMACYPVGDHHLGMLSWRPETGASWDLEIAEAMLTKAFQQLVPLAPRCRRAVIPFLGDLFHYDNTVPMTTKGKHMLDADSRRRKLIGVGFRLARRVIEIVAEWHDEVLVIFEAGNHDEDSMGFLTEGFHHIYADNERITIDRSPARYHYFRHGKCLVGVHHGDLSKPQALAEIMPADRPQDWGETEHRYWWTGHVHSRNAQDFRGCSWESFRVLPPADAWTAAAGYRSIRDMTAIVLHSEHGEVARYRVNPSMVQ